MTWTEKQWEEHNKRFEEGMAVVDRYRQEMESNWRALRYSVEDAINAVNNVMCELNRTAEGTQS